jgi:hypothetical protein
VGNLCCLQSGGGVLTVRVGGSGERPRSQHLREPAELLEVKLTLHPPPSLTGPVDFGSALSTPSLL